jgi:hypothetical protein
VIRTLIHPSAQKVCSRKVGLRRLQFALALVVLSPRLHDERSRNTIGHKVGKGYSPTFGDEKANPLRSTLWVCKQYTGSNGPERRIGPCTSDRVMIVYVSTLAPEHYRIDLPEIERPADVSEREERILVSALILTRLRS